ncbi:MULTISPECIES: FAD-binding domain-containing protein [Cylindrospermopsis]|uniref:FAD-binding domain-containing protein n=1 Tax=Cylindrospermopsis TaxID=77021 RepID=UPI000710B388|nr:MULTISPECIES: FAD-binding domain-containing protein [Cylindrospermopsis]KRH97295.1 deoxyribodipyrimidine photolyase [Cylindrospermopsis sp. CR12]MBU6345461.1 deoxyribodipyrimidine photo-lyase [Cyanobacteria bacterium REEB494]TPX28085.1 deoxyribodipyrimidine photo-lyase [Cylindrospermopsis raciborskii GIHE 2018]UJL34611.1 deoxyribodipyrimidine photo-lyase [Cylindrospermopsis raciborskii Cr2010]
MLRDFANREELVTYIREQFPQAAQTGDYISGTSGGRKAAVEQLEKVNAVLYAKTRNYLTGAVTRLSPYIRHGVLSLREVREYILNTVENSEDGSKLINELGWRDYWQRLYMKLGKGIWENQEEYKTGYHRGDYSHTLPEDIQEGKTGLVCIDSFSQELRVTGYLHNHIRMWLASYIIHWRKIQWQAGAKWFLQHLLDGDPASNNMSWQWVASTFSHKPYFFNRENLERYTKGVYCSRCPLYGKCVFEGSYEDLQSTLFPHSPLT